MHGGLDWEGVVRTCAAHGTTPCALSSRRRRARRKSVTLQASLLDYHTHRWHHNLPESSERASETTPCGAMRNLVRIGRTKHSKHDAHGDESAATTPALSHLSCSDGRWIQLNSTRLLIARERVGGDEQPRSPGGPVLLIPRSGGNQHFSPTPQCRDMALRSNLTACLRVGAVLPV